MTWFQNKLKIIERDFALRLHNNVSSTEEQTAHLKRRIGREEKQADGILRAHKSYLISIVSLIYT